MEEERRNERSDAGASCGTEINECSRKKENIAPADTMTICALLSLSSSQGSSVVTSSTVNKKLVRQKQREDRINGKLTTLRFENITAYRNGAPDFIVPHVLHCIIGSRSQFDARSGKTRQILPILTTDCCQTFATLSAVLLSSHGRAEVLRKSCNTSTVNYLLYISAWLHQLTRTSWPKRGTRPSVSDLNTCLLLQYYFPSKVEPDKFQILFYNQSSKALELLHQLCVLPSSAKRQRQTSSETNWSPLVLCSNPLCGYVVVSGDYTVSIFSVEHHHLDPEKDCYSKAWTLYICDSHGTQPWSLGKASICGVTFGIPTSALVSEDVISVDAGIQHFSTILFTLLEEHRTAVPRRDERIPYMTWTPITRRRSQFLSGEDIKRIIQEHWLPKTLRQPSVTYQANLLEFNLLPCFWGLKMEKVGDS